MADYPVFCGPKTNLQPTYFLVWSQRLSCFMASAIPAQEISKQMDVFSAENGGLR